MLFVIGKFSLSDSVMQMGLPVLGVESSMEDLFSRLTELAYLFSEIDSKLSS